MNKWTAVAAMVPAVALAVDAGEYAARRARVASAIGSESIFVLLPRQDVPRYGFRQDPAILYLTGMAQSDTGLVLISGDELREVIFVPDRDPLRELWTGKLLAREEVMELTGVATVASSSAVRQFVSAALGGASWGESTLYGYYRTAATPNLRSAVKEGRATVWLLLENRQGLSGGKTPEQEFARDLREAFPEIRIRDASPILAALREVKSPAEMALLQRAIDITAEAQKAGMRRALTASHEYQIEAAIESTFRENGATPGFPSIVGAGRNATVLHYETNQEPVIRNGLVLADIGAEVQGYTADVTRTYPANGTFSTEQRAIYEAVLAAQSAAHKTARPGRRLVDVHLAAQDALGPELLRLGLITKNEPEQVQMYLRHGVSHPIGLLVHDSFDRTRVLEPGMMFTIEPGVYVREDDVRASAAYRKLTPDERKQVEAALSRYGGIGVRIEDDYVVTADGARLLSGAAPRTVTEIEAWMRR